MGCKSYTCTVVMNDSDDSDDFDDSNDSVDSDDFYDWWFLMVLITHGFL